MYIVDSISYDEIFDYCIVGNCRSVLSNRVSSVPFCVHGQGGFLQLVDEYANRSAEKQETSQPYASSKRKSRRSNKGVFFYEEVVAPDHEKVEAAESTLPKRRKCASYLTTKSNE